MPTSPQSVAIVAVPSGHGDGARPVSGDVFVDPIFSAQELGELAVLPAEELLALTHRASRMFEILSAMAVGKYVHLASIAAELDRIQQTRE